MQAKWAHLPRSEFLALFGQDNKFLIHRLSLFGQDGWRYILHAQFLLLSHSEGGEGKHVIFCSEDLESELIV